ncbi:WhiB family transcriptional regulator [Actinomadura sp. NPDC047616]|uniref:WhiB family transcriptional regulator n=1 Tax=Actinomadura sp. NPDC047616 TaxID=3155914 RepID=UPI0033D8278E
MKVRHTTTTPGRAPAVWEDFAACKGMDTDIFFPEDSGWTGAEQADRAKAVCHACPVEADCLDFALLDWRLDGIWGGMTAEERRAERRRRQRATARHTKQNSQHQPPKDAPPHEAARRDGRHEHDLEGGRS